MPEGRERIDTPSIYADLQHRLLTGAFDPGSKLMPTLLHDQYGVSANTVRDVLLQLSKVGLVDFEIQRGFRARAVSQERRSQVAAFRVLLEQEGAVLSMRNGGLAWEARLSAAHHSLVHIERQLARAPENTMPFVGIWSDAELTFHRTLISECKLPPLIETFEHVYMQFRQQMVGLEANCVPSYFERIVVEHEAIMDAAVSGDEPALRAAIRAHQSRHLDR
ncbi:GntR family transcriptional regulator [Jannaschia pagri]|uniref:GntR family transcriptional regulator n=1 Tax=Jannaschia pagri TaxID=2829797 RepID=A0ABQ4NQ06_9RHOB|nr:MULTISPECIES: GntR family transcriptional regulator [unclassified Jannaschia]GIT92327.1 GntR family transcriptional regulator [Jannaschia sp. AI_61]GIT96162.1 GntR family transcriptional regulator [Jannaschia sp. AI_62]